MITDVIDSMVVTFVVKVLVGMEWVIVIAVERERRRW